MREHIDNNLQWYVIHTHPKQEDRADCNLRAWQVETFAPKFRDKLFKNHSSKPTFVTRPLFPRYIFARFDIDKLLHKVRFTRGIHDVVGFGGRPSPVDEEILALIKSRVSEDGFIRTGDDLNAGDKVVIKGGPFKNFMGVFERKLNDLDRVRILLETVSYQAYIEVESNFIAKVS